MRALLLLGAIALAALSSGCTETSCNDRDPEEVPFAKSEGIRRGDTFLTSEYGGPYLYFPPGRTYVFEHGLGGITSTDFEVAFSAYGNLAPAAGDISVVHRTKEDPNSEQTLRLLNNTCSDFYLWVSLRNAALDDASEQDGAAGASGIDGQAGAAGVAGE